MAKDEEHLSPEEKLLRVIQGSNKRKGSVPARSAPSATGASAPGAPVRPVPPPLAADAAAVVTEAASPPPEAVKSSTRGGAAVRLKGKEAGQAPPEAVGKPVGGGAPAVPAPGRAPAPHRPATPSGWSLRTVNIVLAALVLIVLLFTGNEIWANVRVQDVGPRLETLNLAAALDLDPDRDLPPLEALLDSIDERALFAVASAKPDPVVETVTVPPDQYCSLLGISRIEGTEDAYEAIIMDSKIKKMLYLKVGDAISADGQLWTLKEIQGDRVVFTSGNRESVVR